MTQPRIQILGATELRAALRGIDKGLAREVGKALKAGAQIARPRAAALEPHRSGTLADSVKAGASGAKAYLKSSLIYAGVHEYGGRVGRKHAVRIKPSMALNRGVDESLPKIIDVIGDGIDALSRKEGF